MARLLGADPVTRKKEVWHEGHHGEVAVESRQDVTEILEANKEERKRERRFDGDFHHVGRIPNVIYEDLMRRGIASDPDAFKKWLNSEEARPWRTMKGRV